MEFKQVLITLLFFVSCDSKPKDNLKGIWIMKYNASHFITDTTAISQYFDFYKEITYSIKTDSGHFNHTYFGDSLISIDENLERTIYDFEFDSDNTGRLFIYDKDINSPMKREDRIYGQESTFEVLTKDSLMIKDNTGTYLHSLRIENSLIVIDKDTLNKYVP